MDPVINIASTLTDRVSTNLRNSFTDMTPEKFIRIVIIAGGYLLLRQYLIKMGGRAQMRAHEEEEARSEEEAKAKMSANELRGKVDIPEDTDDEDDATAEASGPEWGQMARRRQRVMLKRLLDAEEQRLQENQEELEDKDIEEFLIKT
ncbi:protein trafficking Pga2 [Staphylotrichum tortipilum]|uniref:Protein trafficking Pga2 n=1 Tax=Staphylotrichum tortipilum TaxID=2831512 RepID=A0AAN6MQ13_9PEZI|nr:protein trafficking Pga2 [Staphylotrichum longicolle]